MVPTPVATLSVSTPAKIAKRSSSQVPAVSMGSALVLQCRFDINVHSGAVSDSDDNSAVLHTAAPFKYDKMLSKSTTYEE
jgi:hypothetical protein